MSYGSDYPEYVTVAEKKEKNKKKYEKLSKKNPDISPVVITGSKLAATWWGKAWNNNLETYSDYSNRMPRGRSYIRHGAILDLKITPGGITALVQGSRAKPYVINIAIASLAKNNWDEIIKSCEGKIESLQELLDGKFPKALAELFTAKNTGLFPSPKEISLNCTCPDWANMCKHVAAALYGVGARLDENPALFFVLRNVNIDELVSKAIAQKSESLLKKSGKKTGRVINDDVSAMFGIDLESESQNASPVMPEKKMKSKQPRKPLSSP